MGEQQNSTNRSADHWYARYNQVYRKRVTYMAMAKNLQNRLKLNTDENNQDCLRSKAILHQRSPVIWNHKACTCQKCKATTMTTYYTGSLYLSSQMERNSVGGTTSGLQTSRSMDDRLLTKSTATHLSDNSFQTVIQNSYRGKQWHPGKAFDIIAPSIAITAERYKPLTNSYTFDDHWTYPPGGGAPMSSVPSKDPYVRYPQKAKLPPIVMKRNTLAQPGPILPLLGQSTKI